MPVETRGARKRRSSTDASDEELQHRETAAVHETAVAEAPERDPPSDTEDRAHKDGLSDVESVWKRTYARRCMVIGIILSQFLLDLLLNGSVSHPAYAASCALAVYSLIILLLSGSRRDPTFILYHSESTMASMALIMLVMFYRSEPSNILIVLTM